MERSTRGSGPTLPQRRTRSVTSGKLDVEVLPRDPWSTETDPPVQKASQICRESRAGAIGAERAGSPRGDADLTGSFGFDTGDVVEGAP